MDDMDIEDSLLSNILSYDSSYFRIKFANDHWGGTDIIDGRKVVFRIALTILFLADLFDIEKPDAFQFLQFDDGINPGVYDEIKYVNNDVQEYIEFLEEYPFSGIVDLHRLSLHLNMTCTSTLPSIQRTK